MSEEARHRDAQVSGRGEKEFAKASSNSDATPSTLRVFCALELPAEVRARAAEHSARLREASGEVRASWERAEKMHLTLKFLGEIPAGRVKALSDAAASAALRSQSFILALKGTGAFPPRGNPRVLWLGIEDSANALHALHKRLEEACAAAGFAREERPFHPHLTLVRIRAPQGARQLAELHLRTDFERIEFAVADLFVLRSELGQGGSRYTEISRHRFGVASTLSDDNR